jgi:signal transduction histidine kinase
MKPVFCILLFAAICLKTVTAQTASLALTEAAQVLKLSISEAQTGAPVLLRGVVISGHELDSGTAVIQDDSGSIFVRGSASQAVFFARTNRVEIRGTTGSGEFAPIVVATEVRVLSKGEIPAPKRVAYGEFLMGRLDSQWLEVEGCLRSCVYWPTAMPSKIGGTEAELATGGGRLAVEVFGHGVSPDWVDGMLRVRGICFHKFNQKHQFYQMYLVVPEGEPVLVEQPPVSRPFDLPAQSIGSLLQYAQAGSFGHRVRVHGVVIYQHPGEFLFIRGEDRGLFVRTLQETTARVGDEVSVVGFPAQGDYSPILEDAVFQVMGHAYQTPVPIPIRHPNEAFEHDAELISGEAKLIGYLQKDDGLELSLQMGNSVFTAFLMQSPKAQSGLKIVLDSEIGFTGVCSVVMGSLGPRTLLQAPQSFRVMLRSSQDLSLIRPPPWWTSQRIIVASSIIVLGLTTGISLFARMRFQRQQAERRQAEAEFAAILKERNRLAREIHDTLAQDISGISAQLEVARKKLPPGSDAALKHLNLAQTTARNSLQEARRTIWNMRSQVLEGSDLSVALSELLGQETQGTGIRFKSVVLGTTRQLPSAIENDLLRIGQEAIHNAIHHAQPSVVTLELVFADKKVRLSVRDDGVGFDQEKTKFSARTRFGIKGMQERARQTGGSLTLRTAPGQGTEITLEVPLI